MIIKNTKTNEIQELDGIDSLYSPKLGPYFTKGDCRELTPQELTQYTTDKEAEFLLEEKQKAIKEKRTELIDKKLLGTFVPQDEIDYQNLINS